MLVEMERVLGCSYVTVACPSAGVPNTTTVTFVALLINHSVTHSSLQA